MTNKWIMNGTPSNLAPLHQSWFFDIVRYTHINNEWQPTGYGGGGMYVTKSPDIVYLVLCCKISLFRESYENQFLTSSLMFQDFTTTYPCNYYRFKNVIASDTYTIMLKNVEPVSQPFNLQLVEATNTEPFLYQYDCI